jgi:hypothetical protein
MANSIELAKKYAPVVDGVFKKSLRTGILDTSALFNGVGINQAQVLKVSTQKLATYADGYVAGDVTSVWETITLPYKRSRQLRIEATDNEENFNRLLGATLAEFIKTAVAPELDAIRFAQYASKGGIGVVSETITASNAYASLLGALGAIDNGEADLTNSVLYVSSGIFAGVNQQTSAGVIMTINELKTKFGLLDIIYVPQSRFNTQVSLATNGAGGLYGSWAEYQLYGY